MSQITADAVTLTDDECRALLNEAKSRKVLDRDHQVPSDPQDLAKEILQIAIDEWERSTPAELKGQIGDDVKAILGLGHIYPDTDNDLTISEEAPDAVSTDEPTPADETSEADAERSKERAESEDSGDVGSGGEDAGDGAEEPWEGYDSDIIPNVLKKLNKFREDGDLDQGAIDYVLNYEKTHKKRKGIIDFLAPTEKSTEGHEKLDEEADAAIAKDDDDPIVKHERHQAAHRAIAAADPVVQAEKARIEAELATARSQEESATERLHESRDEVKAEVKHLAGVQEASSFLTSFKRENLPEPEQPSFTEDPRLPNNLGDISDGALQQLYMDFGACLSRSNWLLGLAQAEEARLERITKRERAKAYLVYKDVKPADAREAAVDLDDEVQKWEEAHNEAEQEVKGYTKLSSAYQGNVDRLSRIMAFRLAEQERARA